MKFSKIIFIFFLVPVCLFSQQIIARAESSMEFYVLFDKKQYEIDEPMSMNFKLKNNKNKAVYINKRLYVNSESSDPSKREVFLRVKGPSGQKISPRATYDTGLPKTDYFELLQPKKEVMSERKKNLKRYFKIEIPGVYTIQAVYHNVHGDEIGLDTFKEKVISNPITIKLVKQKSKQDKKKIKTNKSKEK